MTAFATDKFIYEDELWQLLMTSQDHSGQLFPIDFDFKIHYFATDYSIGYTVFYTLNQYQLMIDAIEIRQLARIELNSPNEAKPTAHQSDLPKTFGSLADWNSDRRWTAFANLPAINGVLPSVKFYTKSNDEWVDYGHYENLNLALDYSGGFLIATDGGHRGFPTPHTYQRVIELRWENGKLLEAIDQSDLVQDIIRDADNPSKMMSQALTQQHPDNHNFHYKYPVLF
jgi:hypothetical protein